MPLILDSLTSEGRLRGSQLIIDLTSQAVANGTLSLVASSNSNQYFTGTTAGQIVKLPDATTLLNGRVYYIWNQSTQPITVRDNGNNLIRTVNADTFARFHLMSNATSNGTWAAARAVLTSFSQDANATANTTTTSVTDVLVDSMSVTPVRGIFRASFSSSVVNSNNGAQRTFVSLYVGGVQLAYTEIPIGTGGGAYQAVSITAQCTVDGTQAIEARWRVAGGTSTMTQRVLSVVRTD